MKGVCALVLAGRRERDLWAQGGKQIDGHVRDRGFTILHLRTGRAMGEGDRRD